MHAVSIFGRCSLSSSLTAFTLAQLDSLVRMSRKVYLCPLACGWKTTNQKQIEKHMNGRHTLNLNERAPCGAVCHGKVGLINHRAGCSRSGCRTSPHRLVIESSDNTQSSSSSSHPLLPPEVEVDCVDTFHEEDVTIDDDAELRFEQSEESSSKPSDPVSISQPSWSKQSQTSLFQASEICCFPQSIIAQAHSLSLCVHVDFACSLARYTFRRTTACCA